MTDEPELEKTYDLRIRSAERAHDDRRTALQSVGGQVLSFSNSAMRAPALVAAGGVAAALGFYSANYGRLAANPENLAIFNEVLFWLFGSLLLTVIAPGLAYFSQILFAMALAEEEYHWKSPYIRDTPKSKRRTMVGQCFRWATILTIGASIVCLVIGGFSFLSLIHAP
ncbi:hypothetical protein NKH14_17555 [Mesorhizobium sp. M1380]|uniref:hypothetical protein n=1 Tax=Mesorhizobium sp. M1380 TaxID=2957093 RepID=UPI003337292C